MAEGYEKSARAVTALAIAVLATAIFAASVGWRVGGELTTAYVDDLGTVLAALAASVLCLHAGIRQRDRLRRFWWLLAAACAAWTLGEVIWAVYDLVLGRAVPLPSWADVGYLGAIPLAVAALLSHPATGGDRTRTTRSLLEGVLVATALLLLSWTIVLGPLWHSTDLTTLGGLVAVAYPFGDVVIAFPIVLVVCRMPTGDRLPLWCLLSGLLALALSDSVYAYLTQVQGYETGSLIDTGWFAGYLAIAVGAFCSDARPVAALEVDAGRPALAGVVVPFVPILAALSVVAFKPHLLEQIDPVAYTTASALVVLVLVRQLLVVRDIAGSRDEPKGNRMGRLQAALGVRRADEPEQPQLAQPRRPLR